MPIARESIRVNIIIGRKLAQLWHHLKDLEAVDRNAEINRLIEFAVAHGALNVGQGGDAPVSSPPAATTKPAIDTSGWIDEDEG